MKGWLRGWAFSEGPLDLAKQELGSTDAIKAYVARVRAGAKEKMLRDKGGTTADESTGSVV